MKITMILSRLDQTGMTTHTLDLAEALVRKKHHVTILVGRSSSENSVSKILVDKCISTGANIDWFPIPDRHSTISLLHSTIKLIFKIIKLRGVIHVQSPYLSWIPYILRKKFVSTFHVNDLIKCFYYKNATHLIAISKETKEYAKCKFGYKDDEISIINHGVSMEFSKRLTSKQITETRQALNLPVDKIIITLVGSIERRKGQDILLKAIEKLPQVTQDKLHIVFLGSDKTATQENEKWIEKVINDTRLRNKVTRFEYQDSKIFYQIGDIFLLPSWLEGFGLVVIEAMLAGNLCIRTDTEGASEQIEDGKSGFIFPKGDIEKLRDILAEVLENDSLRNQIAKNGRDFALEHFTSDVMAEKTLLVYKKIFK